MKLLLTLLFPLYLLSYSKVALVIGNKSYSSQTILKNPIKDAKMIRDRLEAMDFEVLKVYDGDMNAIDKKLIEFGRLAKKAKVAVIFYAGHGIGYGGKNYLIPINTQNLSVDNIQRKLVGVSELQKKVAKASGFGVVFFDACRSAYFTDAIEGINSRGNNRALVPPKVSSRSNILVSFSTQAGTIAKDDVGGDHSPYAIALDEYLELSKDIRLVVGSVGERVAKLTQNNQTPISRSSLGGKEYKLISARYIPPTTTHTLTIYPTPSNAKIYIMGIKPKYRDGIRLKAGEYRVKVIAQGYKSKTVDISLSKDSSYSMELEKKRVISSSKWITPTNSQCKGGKMYKGVCQAKWKDAKKICSSLGGRLSNIDELTAEVEKCGGEIANYGDSKWKSIASKNYTNKSYQACYKNNGFSSLLDYYWSSTTYKGDSYNAWIVYFNYGYVRNSYKDSNNFVRCVRAGE